jgi:hypothetical protein
MALAARAVLVALTLTPLPLGWTQGGTQHAAQQDRSVSSFALLLPQAVKTKNQAQAASATTADADLVLWVDTAFDTGADLWMEDLLHLERKVGLLGLARWSVVCLH